MSLINKMLKDLENRERPTTHEHMPFTMPNMKNKASHHNKIYLMIPLVLAIIAVIIVLSTGKKNQLVKFATVNPVAQKTAPPQPNTISGTWTHPASITGISLQSKNDITEIAFLLDHSTLYRIAANEAKNVLTVIFPYAKFRADPPQLNYLNTALQSITSINAKDEVHVKLDLKPGAIIQSVNMIGDEKNAQVVVKLIYHPPLPPQITEKKTKIIKTPALESILHDQYQLALLSAEKGEALKAIEQLNTILKTAPDYNDARVSLSALLLSAGKHTEATKILDQGLNMSPDYLPFIELKARILTSQGKIKEALALLQTQDPQMQDNPDYLSFLAALYERNEDHLLAIKLYKQLISSDPENGNWWFGLGLSLEKMGQSKQAYAAYQRAVSEGKLNTDSALYLQTRLHNMQEQTDDTK